jgi:hypothetical protein
LVVGVAQKEKEKEWAETWKKMQKPKFHSYQNRTPCLSPTCKLPFKFSFKGDDDEAIDNLNASVAQPTLDCNQIVVCSPLIFKWWKRVAGGGSINFYLNLYIKQSFYILSCPIQIYY